MKRLKFLINHAAPFVLALAAGLFLAFYSNAAPTASTLDSSYRFALGAGLVLGLRHAPWPLLFVSSAAVGLFANSPLVLVCAASGITLTLGFAMAQKAGSMWVSRREQKTAEASGATIPTNVSDPAEATTLTGPFDASAARLLWVAFVLTIALSDLTDRWGTFSASGAVGWVCLVAALYFVKDLTPKARFAGIGLLGAPALAVVALTGYYGWEAQHHVADVEALRASLTSDEIPDIDAFDTSLSELQSSLDRRRFRPLESVPLAAQNVRSMRQLMDNAGEVIDAAGALNSTPEGEPSDKSSAAILQKDELSDLCWALANLDASLNSLSGEEYLVPKLRSAVVELDSELGKFDQVDRYCPVTNRVEELLGFEGKRTYLTLFMTTAEVRGIGGLVTNWALIEFDHAEVNIIDSGRSVPMNEQLAEVKPTLNLPEDTGQLWEIYAVDKYFQDIGATPDAEVVASTASQLFEQVYPNTETDGVMILGPKALAGLVATVGEVKVGDHTVDAEGTVEFLTKEQYELDISYGERVQMLDSLLDGVAGGGSTSAPADPVTSLRLLGEAISAGELMLIPDDPTIRKELEGSPLLGALPPTSEQQLVGVVEQNFGLDKLDPYLERSAELTWDSPTDSSPVLTLDYLNSATPTLPEYVLGIGETAPGVNRLRLASYAPVHARSVTVVSQDGQTSNPDILYGSEKGHQASVVVVDTPPEGATTVQFEFEDWLPPTDAIQVLKPASINNRSLSIVVGDQSWSSSGDARLSPIEFD